MKNKTASKNIQALSSLLTKKITLVERQIFTDDMKLENFEKNADGPIQLTFNDNSILTLTSLTEVNSVGVSFEKMKKYGSSYSWINCSNTDFWKKKLNTEVLKIKIVKSIYADEENVMEFAIKFELSNGSFFSVEYISDDDHDDMLIISNISEFDNSNEILVGKK